MNRLIPSFLLPLCQNKSLRQTIGIKIYVICTFIRIKIKSFSCETFCTSTRCEKEANGNSEVEVKPASFCACQAAHQARAWSSVCSMKRLEVFLLSLGLDASPSQGYLQHLSGSLSKSGPLDFGKKNNFSSIFVNQKGLVCIKSNLLFSSFLFLLCYEPKLPFGRTEVADRNQKGKIHRFCEACYVP